MKSPVTRSSNATRERSLSVRKIIHNYSHFKIDVTRYFAGLTEIEIFRCDDTGYRFYYPLTLSGDSAFYEHFQKFDWYYMPWKWEHELTTQYIRDGMNLLEVGCGQGAFLEKLAGLKQFRCTGLELNETATQQSDAVRIVNETVETHSAAHCGEYDVVCSYQVLEHIAHVRPFMEGQLKCLKTGGLLIVSVPNNESFIRYDVYNAMNVPPHHMGLWDTRSLKCLAKEFGMELQTIEYEPLQDYHFETYIISKLPKFSKLLTKIIYNVIRKTPLWLFVKRYLTRNSTGIKGHTILAVYRKLN